MENLMITIFIISTSAIIIKTISIIVDVDKIKHYNLITAVTNILSAWALNQTLGIVCLCITGVLSVLMIMIIILMKTKIKNNNSYH